MTDQDYPIDAPLVSTGPDPVTRMKIENIEALTVCGGRFAVVWQNGPWKGLRVTAFCWRPGCIETRQCTGARFIPHLQQWTGDPEESASTVRKITSREAVAMVRLCAQKATGKDDPRTDEQILGEVETVHAQMLVALRGGTWSL